VLYYAGQGQCACVVLSKEQSQVGAQCTAPSPRATPHIHCAHPAAAVT
jgi:hypothetical protein